MADVDSRHRLVVLGSGKSGKSSILKRFLTNTFTTKYKETVEDLITREYTVSGQKLNVDMLDTAGNFAFPAMRRLSISTAHAFLLVYSIDDPSSYKEIQTIYEQIKEQRTNYEDIPLVIAGNKRDLDRSVEDYYDMEAWLENEGLQYKSVEVSAKDGTGIIDIFQKLLEQAKLPQTEFLDNLLQKKRRSVQELSQVSHNDETETKDLYPQEVRPGRRKSAFAIVSFLDQKKNGESQSVFSRSRSLIRRRSSTKVYNKVKSSAHTCATGNDCVIS